MNDNFVLWFVEKSHKRAGNVCSVIRGILFWNIKENTSFIVVYLYFKVAILLGEKTVASLSGYSENVIC